MDKKVLQNLVEGMVTEVSEVKKIDPGMARALVGFVLTQNRKQIVDGINVPNVTLGAPVVAA